MEPLITIFIKQLGMEMRHFEKFRDEMRIRVLKKKEHLIREGSVCDFIGVVTSGTLRSYIKNNDEEFNNIFISRIVLSVPIQVI